VNSDWIFIAGLGCLSLSVFLARQKIVWASILSIGCITLFAFAISILLENSDWQCFGPVFAGGQKIHVLIDGVSAWFLGLITFVGCAGAWYSLDYWTAKQHPESAVRGRIWWSALLLSMILFVTSANGLHLLLAWETFAISAYFLITLDNQRRDVRSAGWLYIVASHAGTLILFAFFSLLAAKTGGWGLGPMRDRPELAPLVWLVIVGFGIKAGIFGLHIWLPSAHANAPSHVSAIMSGVAIKMGIYGIVRFTSWLPVTVAEAWTIAILGTASAVLGVIYALGQHDLKRLLAYHSVENIGIILMGLGFGLVSDLQGHPGWSMLFISGSLLHVWNHGLFKSLLFFGAGSVLHTTGTREMSRMGGLWRAMPWTAFLFCIGAIAISGLPPLNGFVSEWLIYLGFFDVIGGRGKDALLAVAAAVFLAMTGALALACFVKVCGVVFLGAPRSPKAEHAHECSALMRSSMLLLATACGVIGLFPWLIWPVLSGAVQSWLKGDTWVKQPDSLLTLGSFHLALAAVGILAFFLIWKTIAGKHLTRQPTWDCGYASPDARMQYTAGSFAASITYWFRWVLFPIRHIRNPDRIFPHFAVCSEHTPETILERVVLPLANLISGIADLVRRLQHGRVQAYLFYLILGLTVLCLVSLIGGSG